MSQPREEIDSIFLAAIEIASADERVVYLREACGGDAQLLAQLERLIAAHLRAGTFLEAPAHGLPAEPAESLQPSPGNSIGPFQLLEQLGEGGMGVVYRARQVSPIQREVALKVIRPGMDTRQVISRFNAERQALAVMDHPNIAKVFDAGATKSGQPYFVMELVAGEPVTDYCDRHGLSIPERLGLFTQVCRAVQHAHQKGIIHRDLKPSNVLVGKQDGKPFVKVIDFGVAKATDSRAAEKSVFTEERQLVGTPQYMSPEQAEGSLDIDTRTDVYSLGVLLYELLTGATPFDPKKLRSAAYGEMQRIIREVDPPTPSTRLSSLEGLPTVAAQRRTEPHKLSSIVKGDLDWIVMKALEKDRGRRYDSPAALVMDVLHHLADEPVLAGPPSRAYRVRKFIRRHRAGVVAAALILLVLIGGIAGTTIGLLEARRQRSEARAQAEEARQQAAIAQAVSHFQTEMLASADPERLLGDKVTVLQAITAASRELEAGKLREQPQVEAGVREIIGTTLRMLGRYEDAEAMLRAALELRRAQLPPGHLGIAKASDALATALEDRGNLKDAEPLFKESLAIIRAARPPDHPDIADSLTNLGHLYQLQARFGDAEPLFIEALAIRRRTSPVNEERLANAINNLAGLRNSQRRYSESEPLFIECLEIRRRVLPAGHPSIANSLMNVGWVANLRGDFARAEPLFRESLEINRKAFPPGHPRVAQSISMVGTVLEKQGKLAEAEAVHRDAIKMFREAHPDGHPDVARSTYFLARLLSGQQRYAEAEPLFREALRVQRKTLPQGHRDIVGCLNEYAVMLRRQGRLEEAASLFREALEGAKTTLPPKSQEVVLSTGNLGDTLRRLGRFTEAEPLLLETERAIAAGAPVPPPRHAEFITAIVTLYSDWDKAEPGRGYDVKSRDWQSKLPATRPATSRSSNP